MRTSTLMTGGTLSRPQDRSRVLTIPRRALLRNATPLFYASLCGHVDVLRLLLQAGAACERATFEGERVLYAALNDTVRNVLLNEGFAFAASRGHDPFLDHLENAFDDQESAHAQYRDLRFSISDDGAAESSSDGCAVLEAHACVLAARC